MRIFFCFINRAQHKMSKTCIYIYSQRKIRCMFFYFHDIYPHYKLGYPKVTNNEDNLGKKMIILLG